MSSVENPSMPIALPRDCVGADYSVFTHNIKVDYQTEMQSFETAKSSGQPKLPKQPKARRA